MILPHLPVLRIHSNWHTFSMGRIYDAAVLLARIAILAWFLPDAIGLIAHCPGMLGCMAAHGASRFSLDALYIEVDTSILAAAGAYLRTVAA